MKTRLTTLLVMALWCTIAVAGTIENFQFYSESLGENRWVQAYLPDGYNASAPDGYPVIYFLHGSIGDNHTSYSYITGILDSEIAAGRIQPIIMIKPDGSGCNWSFFTGCGWVNSTLQGDYEDFVAFDVVSMAEARYNIATGRNKRTLMGHSMGGFGAIHTALEHPDLFCAVASHSGYLYFDNFLTQHVPVLYFEQSGSTPWAWTPTTGVFTGAWFMLAGGFSPNLSNPPYYVDFPLDSSGDIIPATWSSWKEFDPAVLASGVDAASAPAMYFDCGTNDDFLLHSNNLAFNAHLNTVGLAHVWQSYQGDHAGFLSQRFPISLNFIDDTINSFSSVGETLPALLKTLEVYPNPFNPIANIKFVADREMSVEVSIYNLTGQRMIILADHTFAPGPHSLTWNGRDARGRELPAGSYLLRLKTEAGTTAKKISLIK